MTETSDIEDNVKIIKVRDVEKNLEESQSTDLSESYEELNPMSTRIASIMSLNNLGGLPAVENGKWYYFYSFYSMKYTVKCEQK